MSLIPGLPKGLDIVATVNEFLTVLRSIDTKLDELLDEQREANRNSVIDRLRRTSRERMARDRTTEDDDAPWPPGRRSAPADCSLGGECADPRDDYLITRLFTCPDHGDALTTSAAACCELATAVKQ